MRRLKFIVLFVVLLSLLISPVAWAAPAAQSGGFWYTVQWGDTLYSIGRAYGVNPWSIANSNPLANPNYIVAGQQLWIPYSTPYPYPGSGCGYWRPIYGGETLLSISRATGVSPWRIASANGIYNLNLIYAGRSLWIPCYGY